MAGKGKNGKKAVAAGIGLLGLPLAGCVFLPVLVVVVVVGAAGNAFGWVFGGGAPQVSSQLLTQVAERSPSTTIHLWTPTPVPDDCFITPTPQSRTIFPTPVPGTPPVDGGSGTIPPITEWIPTRTPCPTPLYRAERPNPNWTPVPEGYGPRGNPFRARYVVTQAYGCTDFPEFKDQVCAAATGGRLPWFHRGVDLVSIGDKTVYATIEGEVIFAGWSNDGFGIRVYISNPPFLVIYPHLSTVLVGKGQRVVWGEAIGVEGSTGYSTGSHLHYEIHINGAWVDSTPYLNRS